MFLYLVIAACFAVPVLSNSAGAPKTICTNNMTPEHGLAGQTVPSPYSFSGANSVRSGEKLTLNLGGSTFLGFAVQARDSSDKPIGQFKIAQSDRSQTLTCMIADDTLTHTKIRKDKPIDNVKFDWVSPSGFTGKIKFIATVAKDGSTYWIRTALKEVDVQ